ncbi:FG-GAP-like repeat-containing protein [Anaerolineales bacterium HSG6]|nr:FG-GAP-like repeat-containing protein [Anaerolineales bacterium HSG6]
MTNHKISAQLLSIWFCILMIIVILGGLTVLTQPSSTARAAPLLEPTPTPMFKDVTSSAEMEWVGGNFGGSWVDYDNDGWLDVFVSRHLQDPPALHRNDGDGTFTNMYDTANMFTLAERTTSVYGANNKPITDIHGGCWGDYDNDGDQDVEFGTNRFELNPFYINQGDGTFKEGAEAAGISDVFVGGGGRGRICHWFDVNTDGYLDLFKGNAIKNNSTHNPDRLFLNNQDGTFTDISTASGIENDSDTQGIVTGDYDNDGDMDVILTGEDKFRFYRNNGNATFTIMNEPIVAGFPAYWLNKCWGADFGDYDNDGDLDFALACGRYPTFDHVMSSSQVISYNFGVGTSDTDGFDFTIEGSDVFSITPYMSTGISMLEKDVFFGQNKVNPTSLPVTLDATNLDHQNEPTITQGTNVGLYIWYDTIGNKWKLRTTGINYVDGLLTTTGTFSNISTAAAPMELSKDYINGNTKINLLYQNQGDGTFSQRQGIAGVNSEEESRDVSWIDYDNDGWLDMYVVNSGNLYTGNRPNHLYHNNGDGTFTDVAASAGVEAVTESLGDCSAWADYDKNGFLDLLVLKGDKSGILAGPQKLYKNLGNSNHWLQLNLVGTTSNRDGIGAKVMLNASGIDPNMPASGMTQMRQRNNRTHYTCQNSPLLHFGLGSATQADVITITWPSGVMQRLVNQSINDILTITEPLPLELSVMAGQSISESNLTSGSTMTFTLSYTPLADFTVNYSTANGTAVDQVDFKNSVGLNVNTIGNGSFVIKAGSQEAVLNITPLDDEIDEDDETVSLTILSGQGYMPSSSHSTAQLSLVDNDNAGVMLVETGGSTDVIEGGASDSYGIRLMTQPTADVSLTVNPTSNLDVGSGPDAPKVLTFNSSTWNVAQNVTVSTIDDATFNGTHTALIDHTVSSSDPKYAATSQQLTINIADNDGSNLAFSQASYLLNENGSPNGAVVTVNRTDSTSDVSTVEVQFSDGTASGGAVLGAGIDYQNSSQTLTFVSGQSSQTMTISINNDTTDEPNETLTMTLTSPSAGSAIIPPNMAILTIVDDDVPVVNQAPTIVSIPAQITAEDLPKTINVTITDDLTVPSQLTMTVTVSNTNLITASNISIQGQDSQRTLILTPTANLFGKSVIQIKVSDGLLSSIASFTLTVLSVNDPPTLTTVISNQMTLEDELFSLIIPTNLVTDIDLDDSLTYMAVLSDGAALPTWLNFDATNRVFTGTPTNNEVGTVAIRLTAEDQAKASVSTVFSLTVSNVNDAPMLVQPLTAQTVDKTQPFSYSVASSFVDVDQDDQLSYGAVTPNWLNINSTSGLLSGTPSQADLGSMLIQIMATDLAGQTVTASFTLTVQSEVFTPTATPSITGTATPISTPATPTTTVTATPIGTPEATSTPTVSPSEKGKITGQVTINSGRSNGQALEDIMVVAYWFNDATWAETAMTTTDETGRYTLDVPSGKNRLYLFDPLSRYAHSYYGSKTSFEQAGDVMVGANQTTTDIDVTLSLPKSPIVTVSGGVSTTNDPHTQKVSLVADSTSQITVEFGGVSCLAGATPTEISLLIGQKIFPMTLGDNGLYQATVSNLSQTGTQTIQIEWRCNGMPNLRDAGELTMLSDAFGSMGQLTDAVTSQPITKATVILYRIDGAKPDTETETHDCRINNDWQQESPAALEAGLPVNPTVDEASNITTVSPTINPQQAGQEGQFGWQLPEGCWYVQVQADGYQSQTSPIFGTPPQISMINLSMQLNSVEQMKRYLPIIVK